MNKSKLKIYITIIIISLVVILSYISHINKKITI